MSGSFPPLPIPTSNTAAFLICSRAPCTRKYSPFTNYLRLGDNSLLWSSSLTLCFPGLVYTISLSGWPVDQSTLPLTNCISLHTAGFFLRDLSHWQLTHEVKPHTTHHVAMVIHISGQVKSRSKLQIQTVVISHAPWSLGFSIVPIIACLVTIFLE